MTWRDDLLSELVNEGERIQENVIKYDPPVDDFLVYEVSGAVPEGIVLGKAAIVACVSGSFRVDFQNTDTSHSSKDDANTVPWSWRGAKRVSKGNTFFSKAGTRLVVHSADEGAKIFIATY